MGNSSALYVRKNMPAAIRSHRAIMEYMRRMPTIIVHLIGFLAVLVFTLALMFVQAVGYSPKTVLLHPKILTTFKIKSPFVATCPQNTLIKTGNVLSQEQRVIKNCVSK